MTCPITSLEAPIHLDSGHVFLSSTDSNRGMYCTTAPVGMRHNTYHFLLHHSAGNVCLFGFVFAGNIFKEKRKII